MSVAFHQPREALGERVKELTCIYGLSRLAQQSELPLGQLLQGIAELIPPRMAVPRNPPGAGSRSTETCSRAAASGKPP